MKLFIGTIVLSMSAVAGFAQDPAPAVAPMPVPEIRAKVVAELAAVQKIGAVKNSPFSAEEVNESVQTLADGNRIVRSSTGKFYRNSEGRIRREMAGGTGGLMGSVFTTGQGVTIMNPSVNEKYLLDSKLKTAQLVELAQLQKGLTAAGSRQALEERAAVLSKAAGDLRDNLRVTAPAAIAGQMAPLPPMAPVAPIAIAPGVNGGFAYTIEGNRSKYETRTEELGTQIIEGVSAEGTRKTTTIPAGAIGNDRPIEIVYERWFSKELGVVVMSKNSDPRFGEQTYKMTNIVRAEPDPSLFSVPTEYRKITGAPVYRTSVTAGEPTKPSVVRVSGSATSKARP